MINELMSVAMSVHGVYLMPFVVVLMVILASTLIIDTVFVALGDKRSRR